MKKNMSVLFGLFLFFIVPIYGQNDLSDSDKEALQARVKDKVEEFVNHLSNIAKKNELSNYQRQEEIKAALVLFIGNGEKYSVKNEYGENEKRDPVRMQLSSIKSDITRWLAMKKYLWNMYNNVNKYGKVVLQSADIVRVDNINKVSDGHYEAMAYFVQKYIAYRDGKVVYSDITKKKIKVYIEALEIPGGVIWDAKLGDVYVTATNPLGDGK